MNIWVIMLAGGLLTFATRLSFIFVFSHARIPDWLLRGLRYVPTAVLAALITPEIFLPGGHFDLSFHNTRLLAGMAAALVAWRTRNAMLTILVGMAALFLLQWIF